MQPVLDYLQTNFCDELKSCEVARKFGLSSCAFSRKFNKHVGTSFDLYVQYLRLTEARKLIDQGADLKDACYSSGFKSESQFQRSFKRNYGLTPKEYRLKGVLDKKDIQGELDHLLAEYIGKIESGMVGWGVSFITWLEVNNHYLLVGFNKFKKLNNLV